jgi:dipeptidyl aminopeptidase/acylaminoacyl peptidase
MFRLCVALIAVSAFWAAAPVRALAEPPPVEAYGRLPAIERVALSPSGQRYAFIAVVGDTRKLVAATVDGNRPIYAAEVGDFKVVDVEWAGDDHLLVTVSHTVPLGYVFTTDKAELYTVTVIDIATQKSFRVFEHAQGMSNIVQGRFGVAQVDGRWCGYFGGVTFQTDKSGDFLDHTWPDLYRVDLDSGAIVIAAHGSPQTEDWLVSPNGEVVARTLYDQENGAWEVRAGPFAGRVLASGRAKLSEVGDLIRGRSPDTVVIERPNDDGDTFQELSLTGADLPKPPELDGIDSVVADPVSGLWVGVQRMGDQPTPTFFSDAAQARVRAVLQAFPGRFVGLVSFTSDLNRIVVYTSGTGDSGTYWLVDIPNRHAAPLGYERPQILPEAVGEIRMVDYKAGDGAALRGVLSLPPGREAKNLPVIVMPHGGPEARDYPKFDWWAQAFASRGYAVFQPNFRGSDGYGAKFRNAGFGQWGRKMETDLSDGLAELARQGTVDPKRACIVGGSYGGYAALAGVTLQQGLYRCAVSLAGPADLAAMLDYSRQKTDGEPDIEQRYWKAFMGVTDKPDSALAPISPIRFAAQAAAPILLIHGKDDTVVPIDQSQAMERALKAAGKPVDFIVLPGADHHLLREDTRIAAVKASLDFVLKYDPPDPAPAQPAAAAEVATH